MRGPTDLVAGRVTDCGDSPLKRDELDMLCDELARLFRATKHSFQRFSARPAYAQLGAGLQNHYPVAMEIRLQFTDLLHVHDR